MNATARIVRVVSFALALALGAGLIGAKANYTDRFARLTAPREVIVLPAVEVVAQLPHVAAAPSAQRVQRVQ